MAAPFYGAVHLRYKGECATVKCTSAGAQVFFQPAKQVSFLVGREPEKSGAGGFFT